MQNLGRQTKSIMVFSEVAYSIFFGGDFNVHSEAELDSIGERKGKKDSVKNITDIKLAYDLVDIRQIRNPK